MASPKKKKSSKPGSSKSRDEPMEEETGSSSVYLPGQPLEEGEELVCDQSAYIMLHEANTGSPCLSFDVIGDDLGDNRETFPLTAYIVAGSQSARTHTNSVFVMRLSNMKKTQKQEDSEDSESSDSDSDDDEEGGADKPLLSCARIKHLGCVNRIRSSVHDGKVLAATWSELGRVNVFDVTPQLRAVEEPALMAKYKQDGLETATLPLYTFSGHQMEGFALDWCPTSPGMLASGDCRRDIHVWRPAEGGTWRVDQRPLAGHTDSVEDLQWSPNERHVLASCSVDKSICVWDVRTGRAPMVSLPGAHDADVNVISWSRREPLLLSGGDDGALRVWDLRRLAAGPDAAVVTFKHHLDAVTSVEWHPTEPTVFASAGQDDQLAMWDLALEKDDTDADDVKDLPPQLLFIHQGQKDLKELHWHPQLTGVIISTALSGFNIFRTISL